MDIPPLMPRCFKNHTDKIPNHSHPVVANVCYCGDLFGKSYAHYRQEFYAVSFGLRLMQWHEYYIFVLQHEGLVSTSSETHNNKLLRGYNSANLLLILPSAQSIIKIQIEMHNTILSIRLLQGLMNTNRHLEPLVDFRSTSKMTIRV